VNHGELSILIADDHPLFRAALQQVIAQLYPQASLYQAANVAELQQQVEQHKGVDLLLLDLHMPGALGFSALTWFIGHCAKTPAIMISANVHPDTVRRAIDHGAAGFLSKSAEVSQMNVAYTRAWMRPAAAPACNPWTWPTHCPPSLLSNFGWSLCSWKACSTSRSPMNWA